MVGSRSLAVATDLPVGSTDPIEGIEAQTGRVLVLQRLGPKLRGKG